MSAAVVPLGPWDLALAAALILLNAAVSLAFELGLERKLLTAAARATAQLLLLGYALRFVFAADAPVLVVGWMVAMAVLAGWDAVRRTSHRTRGMQVLSTGAMLVAAMTVTLYGTGLVIGVEPWYAPQYLIPIMGMMLGNTLTGVSLGLETALAGYVGDRERIECLLAHGATRAEASRDVVRRSVRTGAIPILNAMAAAGVISIPGMMTGQILAGEDPQAAARYQLFVLLCISGATALGTVGVALATRWLVFDERDRLRVERIRVLES